MIRDSLHPETNGGEMTIDFEVSTDDDGHRYLAPLTERASNIRDEQMGEGAEITPDGKLFVEDRCWDDFRQMLADDGVKFGGPGVKREWKPSKRAAEAIAAMWDAFYAGDRWLRCQQASTARYTVESLRWNGWADVDPSDPRRFRLAEAQLNQNGLTRRVRLFAGATLDRISAAQEAIESC